MKYMVVLLALFEVQEYFDLEARRIGLSTEGSNAMGDPLESEVFLVRRRKRRLERVPPERTTKRNRRHPMARGVQRKAHLDGFTHPRSAVPSFLTCQTCAL